MSNEHAGEISLHSESDIVTARKTVRTVAGQLGFGITDVTRIVTAASELARNAFLYAGAGVMRWQVLTPGSGQGLELTFEDKGPGIADIEQALREGYTTSGGLGLGLPGAKRLMDETEIHSEVGKGTTVVVRKWLRR
ncbi:MAG TPA: anti-sigma regulatory factor [Candidatus Tectomicrobia bacterium]|jgi:serine/threonine-protein kinase RsbT